MTVGIIFIIVGLLYTAFKGYVVWDIAHDIYNGGGAPTLDFPIICPIPLAFGASSVLSALGRLPFRGFGLIVYLCLAVIFGFLHQWFYRLGEPERQRQSQIMEAATSRMEVSIYIRNHQAVVDFFGRWPSFHDSKVLAYEIGGEPESLGFTLHTWLLTNEVDAKGFFLLRNHALVSFRFGGLHDVKMDAFGSGNILSGLEMSPGSDPSSFHVKLDSVMDMSGSFSARSGEVVSVIPCTSDGKVS
jgi:hypothetical protein